MNEGQIKSAERYVGARVPPSMKQKIEARCKALSCKESDYFRRLLMQDLQTTEQQPPASEHVAGRVRHHDYRQLPPNYDGSPHRITIESDGDARAVVKHADGKHRTWIKHRGSEEWIPIAKLIS